MPVSRGRKKFDKREEEIQQKKEAAAEGRLPWFSFPNEVKVKARPLQEMSEESKFYNEDMGAVAFLLEHTNPDDFRKRASCTMEDEGKCRGEEQYREDFGKEFPEGRGTWRAKEKFYINMLVDDGKGNLEVKVVGLSKSLQDAFLEADEEQEGVSNRWWKITRNGNRYLISGGVPDDLDITQYKDQLVDLDKVARDIPYDEQDKYYGLLVEDVSEKVASEAPSSTSDVEADDDKW